SEKFRISSRGKGSSSKGGGGRTVSRHRKIIKITKTNRLITTVAGSVVSARWCDSIIKSTRYGPAACMIIENYPPLPTRSRQNTSQDTTQRLLNHLVLPKHRSSKFSSNRHRKLYQPFRET
ncbi:GSCOCG00010729001-RA-CDS, partial [Cotesia congregata]